MNPNSDVGEVLPLYEIVPISPAIEDHGDVFLCGICKQNFYSILDFVTHKKQEHSQEHRPSQSLNGHFSNLPNPQPSNELWFIKDSSEECNNSFEIVSKNASLGDKDFAENQLNILQTNIIAENITDLQPNSQLLLLPSKEIEESLPCYSCFTCGGCFETGNELIIHAQHHISSDARNQAEEATFVHSQLHTQKVNQPDCLSKNRDKYLQCSICGRLFQNKPFLKKHLTSHRVWPDGLKKTLPQHLSADDNTFTCSYCGEMFRKYGLLRKHLNHHRHEKVYKCIQGSCVVMFQDLERLLSHIDAVHDVVEYHCNKCDFICHSLKEIAEHYQSHSLHVNATVKPQYRCPLCKATFRKRETLKHHMDTVDHVNKCTYCGKSFLSENLLRKHLVQHRKYLAYICDICKKSFKLKHYLLSHLTTHNPDVKHKCSVCYKEFKRKDLLVRHAKIHQPDKKMDCPYKNQLGCNMNFTRSDKMKQHIQKWHKKHEIDSDDMSLEIFLIPKNSKRFVSSSRDLPSEKMSPK